LKGKGYTITARIMSQMRPADRVLREQDEKAGGQCDGGSVLISKANFIPRKSKTGREMKKGSSEESAVG
jgi:hypothetical protein